MVTVAKEQSTLTPEQVQRLMELDMLLAQVDSYLAYLKRNKAA